MAGKGNEISYDHDTLQRIHSIKISSTHNAIVLTNRLLFPRVEDEDISSFSITHRFDKYNITVNRMYIKCNR